MTPFPKAQRRGGSRQPAAAVLAGLALVFGCAAPDAAPPGPPLVVATIFPVGDLVTFVGGDAVRVQTLLPPRASIHTWEATPGQIRSLSHAAAYVTVGGGLDGWLEDMAAGLPELAVLRLTEGMELRAAEGAHDDGDEGTGDPHVWLDPVRVRDDLLPRITAMLEALAPNQAAAIRERSTTLADSLTALDAGIRRVLARAPGRRFLATHGAWGYFAARYGLEGVGSLYEGPGHEPSARGLARLVDAARADGLGAVLAEPQMAETAARALAEEVGAIVVVVDPLGGPGLVGREHYLDLMRYNAGAFARALGAP